MPETFELHPVRTKSPEITVLRSNSGRTSNHDRRDDDEEQDIFAVVAESRRTSKTEMMNRNFGSLSILGLSITLLASWEAIASGFAPALRNGGPSALVWGLLFSITGTMALALSLAEMASICPIAGAQYHWTALFAPPKIRPFITWMQGWITVFAWQAAVASVCFQVAMQLQAMLIFNYPEYDHQRWHGTLLVWAVMLVNFGVNVYAIKILPVLQLIGGICHVSFFVALVVPLVILAPRSTPDFVFRTVQSNGGYENYGISWCIGLLTVTYCFLGFDGAIHMSEEVRNPKTVIPKILVQTILINGSLAFGFVLVLLFCIGDVSEALHSPTGLPVLVIFHTATKSKTSATVMQASITSIGLVSNIGVVASVSRLTWAFARDGGLPFPEFFAHVDPKHHVPFRAIGLVSLTVVLISTIHVGSTTALSAILALTTFSLYSSYLIPIIMLVLKRLRPHPPHYPATTPLTQRELPLGFGPWTLGRFGMAINLYAICFGTLVCIFVPWPPVLPVTAKNMNYAGPVFGIVVILLVVDWFWRGRTRYEGPVKLLLEVSRRNERDEREDRAESRGERRESWGRAK